MKLKILIRFVLLSIALAVPVAAQDEVRESPVTKREVAAYLRLAPDTPEGIEEANHELIEEIKERGVDFALSFEEEWSLHLQDASQELIETIRKAMSPQEREKRLRRTEQLGFYNMFLTNYSRPDLTSKRIAVTAGREFIQRYKGDPEAAEKIRLVEQNLPALERSVRGMDRPVYRGRGRPRTN